MSNRSVPVSRFTKSDFRRNQGPANINIALGSRALTSQVISLIIIELLEAKLNPTLEHINFPLFLPLGAPSPSTTPIQTQSSLRGPCVFQAVHQKCYAARTRHNDVRHLPRVNVHNRNDNESPVRTRYNLERPKNRVFPVVCIFAVWCIRLPWVH